MAEWQTLTKQRHGAFLSMQLSGRYRFRKAHWSVEKQPVTSDIRVVPSSFRNASIKPVT